MGMEYGHQGRGGYSQETAATIDNEIRRLITEAHERAIKLLKENRSILDNMSRVLVEKETIYTEEVQMLMDGASYADVIAEMEKKEGEHEANPFARVTPVSKEHEVLSEEEKADLAEEATVEEVTETAVEETTAEEGSSDEE
jgi:cell division protease FtsH